MLRTLVLERFNQLAHGGAETFGVLFGERHRDELRITAFRALPADSILDPSAPLPEAEREALRNLVRTIQRAPDLSGLEPAGWFRAHPRSDLDLSQRDLEISSCLFPEMWQIAMVMRPGNSTPGRVRLYFRDSDGALHADRAFREFAIPIAEDVPPNSVTQEKVEAPKSETVSTFHYEVKSAMGNGVASGAVEELLPARRVPAAAEMPRRFSLGWATLAWPLALITAACLVGTLYWVTRPARPLALRVQDSAGQLVISWDKTIEPVRNAEGGHLEIADGSAKLWLELEREQLLTGNVTYKRRSADVTVRLVVQRPGVPPREEMARFLGPVGQQLTRAADTTEQNRPATDEASRIAPQQRRDPAYATQQAAALLVPVPIGRATPASEAPPKFKPPSANLPDPSTAIAAVPELAPPPQLSAALPAVPHAQLPPEKLIAVRPPAPTPPAAPSALTSETPSRAAAATHVVPAAAAPATGRLLWIGRLQKSQTLTINGKNCSTGTLIGELPQRPVKFSVSPGDLSTDGIVLYTSNPQFANSVLEPASAQNGWNKTVYTWNPRFANDIAIQESPAAQNGYSRIVLRSKNPKLSVIVIDWALVN